MGWNDKIRQARGWRLAGIALLGALASCGSGGGSDDSSGMDPCAGGMGSSDACETLVLINAERAAQMPPLPALMMNGALQAAADFHNAWMVQNDCFAHVCSGEPGVGARVTDAGYDWSSVGETIAAGYPTPAAVVAGWMNSPGHRAILLGNFTEVGIERANCPSGCQFGSYWTADFANPN